MWQKLIIHLAVGLITEHFLNSRKNKTLTITEPPANNGDAIKTSVTESNNPQTDEVKQDES